MIAIFLSSWGAFEAQLIPRQCLVVGVSHDFQANSRERFIMSRAATVYRMVMDEHVCPYGLKTIDLLKRQGFEVNDHHLTSREETDAFKERHDVETTPQTFIEDERIGGYDDVREYFRQKAALCRKDGDTSYQPVIAIFAVALLLALGLSWAFLDTTSLPCALPNGSSACR